MGVRIVRLECGAAGLHAGLNMEQDQDNLSRTVPTERDVLRAGVSKIIPRQ